MAREGHPEANNTEYTLEGLRKNTPKSRTTSGSSQVHDKVIFLL